MLQNIRRNVAALEADMADHGDDPALSRIMHQHMARVITSIVGASGKSLTPEEERLIAAALGESGDAQ
jgi:hypothetical protein